MAEIIYRYDGEISNTAFPAEIRWLDKSELSLFNEHLTLCGQRNLTESEWDEVCEEGTVYCCYFVDGIPVARACVEKYSADKWEVSDVRTAQPYRNKGYAYLLCRFVTDYILSSGRTPTIRTEEDNLSMQKVIYRLGFTCES